MSSARSRFVQHAIVILGVLFAFIETASPQAVPAQTNKEVRQHAAAEFNKTPLAVVPLAEQIYLFTGDGGNVVAISDGSIILLIDSGLESRASELNDAVYQTFHRPIMNIVNTHWHFDHVGGNQYFASGGVTIIAQEQVQKRLASEYDIPPAEVAAGRFTTKGIPTVTFGDSMTIKMGAEQVRLYHYGPAHTDGDTVIFFEPANIVVLGDIFSANTYPIIDLSAGGSFTGLIAALDRVLAACNPQTKIIPGHGLVVSKVELQAYRDMLGTVASRVEALIASGKSVSQVLAAAPTSEFDAKWGGGYVSGATFTVMAYDSMASRK